MGSVRSILKNGAAALLAACMLWALILALRPMLAISTDDFPVGDDYYYSLQVHDALLAGDSAPQVLAAAFRTVGTTYLTWQGTYSGIFAMCFQPALWGERSYAVTPYLMIGSLLTATFFLLWVVLCRCLKAKWYTVVLIGVPVLLLCMEYLPSAMQGFYWYNGAVYYTFFYALMLLFVGAMLLLVRGGRRVAPHAVCAALLGVLLGGANFVTALLSVLLGCCFVLYCVLERREKLLPVAVAQGVLLAGFLVSTFAPGNRMRQEKRQSMGVFAAIFHSFVQTGEDLRRWTTSRVVLVFVLLLPLLLLLARRSALRFRWPGIPLALSLCLIAAQNVPPFFAMSMAGEGRLRNIVYFSYFLLLPSNLFYLLGWCQRRMPKVLRACFRHRRTLWLCAGAGAVCVLEVYGAVKLHALTFGKLTSRASTSWICSYEMRVGQAQRYGNEMKTRFAVYHDPKAIEPAIPALTVKPWPVCYGDIDANAASTNNRDVAAYYHKDFVAVILPPDGKSPAN